MLEVMSGDKRKFAGEWWTRRLPLEESEEVMRASDVFYYSGWGYNIGRLYLTTSRLLFLPTPINLYFRKRSWMLSEIQEIGRETWHWRSFPMKAWSIQVKDRSHRFASVGTKFSWSHAVEEAVAAQPPNGRPSGRA